MVCMYMYVRKTWKPIETYALVAAWCSKDDRYAGQRKHELIVVKLHWKSWAIYQPIWRTQNGQVRMRRMDQ